MSKAMTVKELSKALERSEKKSLRAQKKALRAEEDAELTKESEKKARKKADKQRKALVQQGTRLGTSMGSAFVLAWLQGRYPERSQIVGMDASFWIGGVLTAASLYPSKEITKASRLVMEGAGSGALAVYVASQGFQLGQDQKNEAG